MRVYLDNKDIDIDDVLIISDNHFLHKNIIEYCKRPFSSVDKMNEVMFKAWNEVVTDKKHVIHCGDIALRHKLTVSELEEKVLNKLNGKIYLIRGNHDPKGIKDCNRFEMVTDYCRIPVDGMRYPLTLTHFKFESWDGSNKQSIHLHGHEHLPGPMDNLKLSRADVGVDAWKNIAKVPWAPVPLRTVIKYIWDHRLYSGRK